MLVNTTGSGEALELGKFKVTWEFTVNLDSGMGVGSAHFVAENGDKLDTKSIGQSKLWLCHRDSYHYGWHRSFCGCDRLFFLRAHGERDHRRDQWLVSRDYRVSKEELARA
jgi:hypothetical protein